MVKTNHIMISMDRESPNSIGFVNWCDRTKRSYQFVEGVDAKTIESVKQYLTPYGYYIIQNQKETVSHFDTLGPIGCFLAHREAWRNIIANESCEYCWIFEEGVSEYRDEMIERVENVYGHFDFLHGHNVPVLRLWKQKRIEIKQKENDKHHYNNGIVPVDKIYYGTKCYRISKSFAKLLFDHSTQFDMHVDSYICTMAIYYSDIIISGHLLTNLVCANSSKRINHSLDINLTHSILYIVITILCIITILLLFSLYRKCKNVNLYS